MCFRLPLQLLCWKTGQGCNHARCSAFATVLVLALTQRTTGLLVSLDSAMVIKIWDYTKGTVIWETRHESDDLTCMIYDYAKSTLVCGTEQCTIVTVDVPHLHNLLELPETTLEGGHHSQHEGEKEGAWEDGGEVVAEEGGLEEGEHDKPVEEQP